MKFKAMKDFIESSLLSFTFCKSYEFGETSTNEKLGFLIHTTEDAEFTLHYQEDVFTLNYPLPYSRDDALIISNMWNLSYGIPAHLAFDPSDNTMYLSSYFLNIEENVSKAVLERQMTLFIESILGLNEFLRKIRAN